MPVVPLDHNILIIIICIWVIKQNQKAVSVHINNYLICIKLHKICVSQLEKTDKDKTKENT